MRLKKIQEALKTKNIIFTYTEEDNCGSLDFQFRGLRYHIWEFVDGEESGVESLSRRQKRGYHRRLRNRDQRTDPKLAGYGDPGINLKQVFL